MSGVKGFAAVAHLRKRPASERGGQEREPLLFTRATPDALAVCAESWLEALRPRNYAEATIEDRFFTLKFFMQWAADRDVTRAGEVTRPILEAFQRYLWRYERPGGKGRRLGWSTQRQRIGCLKDWFRWLTRQNVILHNPASELELPRMEKRLPTQALTLVQVDRLLAVPDVADPLGVRDRAMLHIAYAGGLRVSELTGLQLGDVRQPSMDTIHVLGKGRRERVLPLWKETQTVLKDWLRIRPPSNDGAVFLNNRGEAMSRHGFASRLAAHIETAQRSAPTLTQKRVTPHVLRHTCAIHTLEATGDIRRVALWLGHSSVLSTEIYLRVDPAEKLDILDAGAAPQIKKGTFTGVSDRLLAMLASARAS